MTEMYIPFKRMRDWLKPRRGGRVELEYDPATGKGTATHLPTGSKFSWTVWAGGDKKYFSVLDDLVEVALAGPPPDAPKLYFHLPTLNKLIDKVKFAVPKAPGKYAIPVIQIEAYPDKIQAVALDGHRIAVAEAPAKINPKYFQKVAFQKAYKKVLSEVHDYLLAEFHKVQVERVVDAYIDECLCA